MTPFLLLQKAHVNMDSGKYNILAIFIFTSELELAAEFSVIEGRCPELDQNDQSSSDPNYLQPAIWGHHHQLDDHHRNPNINDRDHLVGQPTSLEAAGDQEVGGESH